MKSGLWQGKAGGVAGGEGAEGRILQRGPLPLSPATELPGPCERRGRQTDALWLWLASLGRRALLELMLLGGGLRQGARRAVDLRLATSERSSLTPALGTHV